MPGPHRRFLERLTSVANIREYVNTHHNNKGLCNAYDSCLAMLRAFRDKHIQIVSRYIIIQAREAQKRLPAPETSRKLSSSTPGSTKIGGNTTITLQKIRNLATADSSKKGLKGTGGTALIPFLKQARDETGEPAIGAFAKKLFLQNASARYGSTTTAPGLVNEADLFNDDSEPVVPIVGLAGYWLNSPDMGGLCSY